MMKNLSILAGAATASTRLLSHLDYTHFPESCVAGNKISSHGGKTLNECSALCNDNKDCKIFQFGVDHGGQKGNIQPGDCILKSSNNRAFCDGNAWNVDVYEKPWVKSTFEFTATKGGETGAYCLNQMKSSDDDQCNFKLDEMTQGKGDTLSIFKIVGGDDNEVFQKMNME